MKRKRGRREVCHGVYVLLLADAVSTKYVAQLNGGCMG